MVWQVSTRMQLEGDGTGGGLLIEHTEALRRDIPSDPVTELFQSV